MPRPQKGKGRSSSTSTCTPWTWSEEGGYYYSKRVDSNGQLIAWRYAQDDKGTGATEQAVDSTPRTEVDNTVNDYQQSAYPPGSDLDSLSEGLQSFNFGSSGIPMSPGIAGLGDMNYSNYGTSPAYQPQGSFQMPQNYGRQSYSNYNAGPSTNPYEGLSPQLPNPMGSSSLQPSYQPQQSTRKLYIAGTPGRKEKLDPKYKVHHESEFYFGRVFKVLWSEPKGAVGASTATRGTEMHPSQPQVNSRFGEEAYLSIRRFVVVNDRQKGHSICVPILTYGRQATTKHGVHPEHHAIVFTGKDAPALLPREQELELGPIKVEPKPPNEKLDPLSRINYAKLYTVECNVKVLFVGCVHKKYLKRFRSSYHKIHSHNQPSYEDDVDENEDEDQGPSGYGGQDNSQYGRGMYSIPEFST